MLSAIASRAPSIVEAVWPLAARMTSESRSPCSRIVMETSSSPLGARSTSISRTGAGDRRPADRTGAGEGCVGVGEAAAGAFETFGAAAAGHCGAASPGAGAASPALTAAVAPMVGASPRALAEAAAGDFAPSTAAGCGFGALPESGAGRRAAAGFARGVGEGVSVFPADAPASGVRAGIAGRRDETCGPSAPDAGATLKFCVRAGCAAAAGAFRSTGAAGTTNVSADAASAGGTAPEGARNARAAMSLASAFGAASAGRAGGGCFGSIGVGMAVEQRAGAGARAASGSEAVR